MTFSAGTALAGVVFGSLAGVGVRAFAVQMEKAIQTVGLKLATWVAKAVGPAAGDMMQDALGVFSNALWKGLPRD